MPQQDLHQYIDQQVAGANHVHARIEEDTGNLKLSYSLNGQLRHKVIPEKGSDMNFTLNRHAIRLG